LTDNPLDRELPGVDLGGNVLYQDPLAARIGK
jgi:hypothetical protein